MQDALVVHDTAKLHFLRDPDRICKESFLLFLGQLLAGGSDQIAVEPVVHMDLGDLVEPVIPWLSDDLDRVGRALYAFLNDRIFRGRLQVFIHLFLRIQASCPVAAAAPVFLGEERESSLRVVTGRRDSQTVKQGIRPVF